MKLRLEIIGRLSVRMCFTWHLERRKFKAISLAFCECRARPTFVECKGWATPQALPRRTAIEFHQKSSCLGEAPYFPAPIRDDSGKRGTGQVRLSTWFGWLSDLRGTMRQVIQCVRTMCAIYIAGIRHRILLEGFFLPGVLDKSAME